MTRAGLLFPRFSPRFIVADDFAGAVVPKKPRCWLAVPRISTHNPKAVRNVRPDSDPDLFGALTVPGIRDPAHPLLHAKDHAVCLRHLPDLGA